MSSLFESLQEYHPVKDVPDVIKPSCSSFPPPEDFHCPCANEWNANIDERLKAIKERLKNIKEQPFQK